MTVHRAKGLEFPLVCVADLGKTGREDDAALRVTDDGRLGMRLASLSGESVDSAEMERIKQEQKADDEEEERRIFYVAATRAEEHLVLSGATDLEKLQEPADLTEPMRWIWRALAPRLDEMDSQGVVTGDYDGREVRVACRVLRPADVDALLPAADRRPDPPEPEPPGPGGAGRPRPGRGPRARGAARQPAELLGPGRLPPLRLPLLPGPRAAAAPARRRSRPRGPRRRRRGRAAGPGPRHGGAPAARGAGLRRARGARRDERVAEVIEAIGAQVRPDDVADVRGLVEGFVGSALAARIGAAERVHAELPFAFTLDTGGGRSLLIDGIVDVHARESERVLVVDYKSDRLEGAEPAERVEGAYAIQRLVYALAALRSGAARAEVAYCFLERPDDPVASTYTADDVPALEAELRELTAGVTEGRFEPTAEPHRGLCADCPGRPALCSWDEDRTLADLAAPA